MAMGRRQHLTLRAQLALEHLHRQPADLRNELRIGRRSLYEKWNTQAFDLATGVAAREHAEHFIESAPTVTVNGSSRFAPIFVTIGIPSSVCDARRDALYPDNLVAEVLAAATSPDEVAIADYLLQQNKNLTGDALVKAAGATLHQHDDHPSDCEDHSRDFVRTNRVTSPRRIRYGTIARTNATISASPGYTKRDT